MNSWNKCVFKLATDLIEWKKAGFSISKKDPSGVPIFKNESNWNAIATGLDISVNEAQGLFMKVAGKESPKDISQRIKTFIESKS